MQQKAGGPLEVLSNKPRLILYTQIRQSGFLYYHAIETVSKVVPSKAWTFGIRIARQKIWSQDLLSLRESKGAWTRRR
jgi:hypothetical protein